MSRKSEDAALLADYCKTVMDARKVAEDRNASELARLQARDRADFASEYASEIAVQNGWW